MKTVYPPLARMKKGCLTRLVAWSAVAVLLVGQSSAQVFNGGLTLSSQAAIDNFNYTQVTEFLRIQEDVDGDITNLAGLSELTTVGGNLLIFTNRALTNVDGLSNLTSVGGGLFIRLNSHLNNLNGLSGLTSVAGDMFLWDNIRLTNINGLSNLSSVGDTLDIAGNIMLPNLDGLSNLTSVGGALMVRGNSVLKRFCGLYTLLNGNGLAGAYVVNTNAINPSQSQIISCGPCSGIQSPTANAGPDASAIAGQTVQLDGSGSTDPDNKPLSYIWSMFSKPSGSTAVLSASTVANPTFVADKPGNYVFRLRVWNGCAESSEDEVTITGLSVPDALQNPITTVQGLPLNAGNKNSLITKLQQAIAKYNAGNLLAARNLLHAFLNELAAFVAKGALTAAQAQPLIDYVNQILAIINASLPRATVAEIPQEFTLSSNYPNPFNPETRIQYGLPEPAHLQLVVYDALGREVRVLVNEEQVEGIYEAIWDGRDHKGNGVASGIYVIRMHAGSFVRTHKMILLR